MGPRTSRAKNQAAQGRASPGACSVAGRGSAVLGSGRGAHGRHCDRADRHGDAPGRELPPSLGVYRLVRWAIRNIASHSRQDGGGAADASIEPARPGAAGAALGSGKDAVRGLGMVGCNGERTHRAFHGEETAPAGTEAEWSAPLRALCSPAYLPHPAWGSGLRCLDSGSDRGPLFDCHVRPVCSPQPRCRDEHFLASPNAERASWYHPIG
jgi:hypothetical protein